MKALISSSALRRTTPSLLLPLLPLSIITNPRKTLAKMSSLSSSSWACKKCTFINPPSSLSSCQICLSPSLSSPSSSSLPPNPQWPCKSCTFLNPITRASCEMCGARDSSPLSRSITIEDDDEALLNSSVGSVFFPLRACNEKRKKRDDDESGGFNGPKSSKGEKDGLCGVINIEDKPAVSSDENTSKTESKTLKVMSYNVWFREDLELNMRMKALGNLIRLHSPDIICLQEVTSNIYDIFQKSSWWNGYYCSVTNDMANTRAYFCMQLSKHQVRSFSCKPFHNSIMGRELCITDLQVGKDNLPLVIATSHLESPCPGPPKWDQMFSKERVEQAKNAINILKDRQNVIFCGDMNWDDKLDGQFPLPDGWVDAWVQLRPNENGLTYDTKSNPMLSGNRTLQKRLDRFVCNLRDFEIGNIEMIGKEEIPGLTYVKEKKVGGEVRKLELPVLVSDHFGLLLTLATR